MIPEKKLTADSETGDEKKAANNSQSMSMKCMAKSRGVFSAKVTQKTQRSKEKWSSAAKMKKMHKIQWGSIPTPGSIPTSILTRFYILALVWPVSLRIDWPMTLSTWVDKSVKSLVGYEWTLKAIKSDDSFWELLYSLRLIFERFFLFFLNHTLSLCLLLLLEARISLYQHLLSIYSSNRFNSQFITG